MTRKLPLSVCALILLAAGCAGENGEGLDDGATGGGPGSGGSASSGGTSSVGGTGTGGVANTGGAAVTGGAASTGGGDAGTGGDTGTGGNVGTGGDTATGGDVGTGGGPGAGGDVGTGGDTGTGGDAGTGGDTGSGGQVGNCTDPEGQVCSSYQVGQHCGLTFEIWTDSSSACMTNTATGFRAQWDAGDQNYLARKGVRPGSDAPIVTYSADYNPGNNNTYLGVYGWTQNPLVEYYIIESFGNYDPSSNAEHFGTVQADGGTYEIYRSLRENQPSIEGTATFWQYWSVRTEKRTSGTVTVKPHFDAWAASGLELGTFYEVSMLVEGYHSSGSADVTVSFQ